MFRRIDNGSANAGRALLFSFLVALALLIMIADQIGLLHPVQQVTSTFLDPVESATYHLGQNLSNFSAFLSDLQKLRQENDDLRQQLADAKSNDAKIADLATQLDLLQKQEQFKNNPNNKNFTTVQSDVLGHDTSGQNQLIRINRGSNDGLKRGRPVLDPSGYLVGRIEKVEATQSVVMLITDNSVAVSISTQRYDANHIKVNIIPADGSVVGQWQNGGTISVLHLKTDADVKPDDWVFTNGEGGTFPANILVGKIGKVTKQDGQPEQQATLLPIADLNHLQHVLVVINW